MMRSDDRAEALDSLRYELDAGEERFFPYRAGKSRHAHGAEARLNHAAEAFGYFFRDGVTAAMMRSDWDDLKTSLRIAALTQGRIKDSITGEEPGKIIHEFPEKDDLGGERAFRSTYSSCDGANWFIIGHHSLWKAIGDTALLEQQRGNLRAALQYNFTHMDSQGMFYEDPLYCGDETRKRIRVTIWKDSGLLGREGGKPFFPTAYALQQALIRRAFRDAADLAEVVNLGYNPGELRRFACLARDRIFDDLWDSDLGTVAFAIDRGEKIRGIFSDGLSLLAYLEPEDVPPEKLSSLIETGMQLATPYGFRTSPHPAPFPDDHPESYQLGTIWPFDQWMIHQAGQRHSIPQLISVSLGCLDALDQEGFAEFLRYDDATGKLRWGGYDTQLWSVSAADYFSRRNSRMSKD